MRRSVIAIAALFSLGLAVTAACSVSFQDNTEADDIFKCETDEDCEGAQQTCQPHPEGNYNVCTKGTNCIDNDKDGRGAPANDEENGGPGFSTCTACENDEPGGCEADCDDNNSNIFPGAAERCDGTDNDCDGETDEMDCDEGSCPLKGNVEEPQAGTSWGCEIVGGKEQCVLTGQFTANDSCKNDGPSWWGICGENTEGEWSQVPSPECTQLE